MRRAVAAAAATVALAAAVAGCGSPEAGTVADKRVDEGYIMAGKVMVPTESEQLLLDAGNGAVGWRDVDADDYAACEVGDHYDGEGCE